MRKVPELRLAQNQGQGPFHHLDTLDHILETVRGVERELAEERSVRGSVRRGVTGSGPLACCMTSPSP